jgi:hypothetical protein
MKMEDTIKMFKILQRPGPTPSKAVQLMGDDCWSYFGNHERLDIMKKIKEQPRLNPTDPKTFKSKEGGQ